MPIHTEDGQTYADEFQLTLGRPITPQSESDQAQSAAETAAARQKASVRPLEGRTEGKTTKVLSEYAPHVVDSFMSLPERALKAAQVYADTGEYDPGPVMETAMLMAGARTPFMKQGDLGIFGGRNAYTANGSPEGIASYRSVQDAINYAQFMEEQGHNPNTIFDTTGLYRGHEGKWKFEIPDTNANLKPELIKEEKPKSAFGEPVYKDGILSWTNPDTSVTSFKLHIPEDNSTLGAILDHPELYKAYPWIRDTKLTVLKPGEIGEQFGGWAKYSHWKDGPSEIAFRQSYLNDPEGLRKLLLHELQHVIQGYEGFAKGGSYLGAKDIVTQFDKEMEYIAREKSYYQDLSEKTGGKEPLVENYLKEIAKMEDTLARFKKAGEDVGKINYFRTAGETEARNVEKRSRGSVAMNKRPWETEAYLPEDQLVNKRIELYDPFDLESKARNMDPYLEAKY